MSGALPAAAWLGVIFRCVAIGQPDGGVVFELVGVVDVLDIVRAFHHIADGEERQNQHGPFPSQRRYEKED